MPDAFPQLPGFSQPPPPPTDEENQGFLGNVMGGVEYIGSTLGKAGAAERGVLSGLTGGTGEQAGWAGLKNLIPFSDTLGITDPHKRISGSDLLEQWGMPSTGHEGFDYTKPYDWVHAASGLGMDIATDPLVQSGVGIGGLTAKGAEAAAGGDLASVLKTPLTVAEQIRNGERALLSFKPLMGEAAGGTNLGLSADTAAKAWEGANYSPFSPLTYIRGTFSKSAAAAGPEYDPVVQRLNDANYVQRALQMGQYTNLKASLAVEGLKLQKTWDGLMENAGQTGDRALSDFVRSMKENYGDSLDDKLMASKMGEIMKFTPSTPHESVDQTATFAGELHQHLEKAVGAADAVRDQLNSLGYNVKELDDSYLTASGWLPRTAPALKGEVGKAVKGGAADAYKFLGRADDLKQLPTGTELTHSILTDGRAMGFVPKTFEQIKPEETLDGLQAWAKKLVAQEKDNPSLPDDRYHYLQQLSKDPKASFDDLQEAYTQETHLKPAIDKAWGPDMPQSRPGLGTPDANGEVAPMTRETEEARWLQPGSDATRGLLTKLNGIVAKVSENPDNLTDVAKNGLFSNTWLQDIFNYTEAGARKAGVMTGAHNLLTQEGVLKDAGDAAVKEWWPTVQQAWSDAKLLPEGLETWVKNNQPEELAQALTKYQSTSAIAGDEVVAGADKKAIADVLENLRINPAAAKALKGFNYVASEKSENPLLRTFDKLNTFLKSMLYSVWPASYGRNLASHFFLQVQDGSVEAKNLPKLVTHYLDSYRFAAGKSVDDGVANFINEFTEASGKSWSMQDVMGEATSPSAYGNKPGGGLDWALGQPLKQAATGQAGWKALNPLAAPGLAEQGAYNLPQTMGMRTQQLQMFTQQSALYTTLREQGMEPASALFKVKQCAMDPTLTSQFDRDVGRRLIPFENFFRQNVPFQISRLMESPGGVGGETMQAMSRVAGQTHPNIYTPSFLQENQAYPVGPDNPEAQSFYRNSIIPFNDLNDLVFKDGVPQIGRSLEKFLSRANPMILAGPELEANKQLSTGRKISDLESPTQIASRGVASALGVGGDNYQGTAVPMLDRFLHYSPVSRVISEGQGVLDPRKEAWMKAMGLTGVGRTGTYDVNQQKLRDLRDAMAEKVGERPNVKTATDYYLPKTARAGMEPEDVTDTQAAIKRQAQLRSLVAEYAKAHAQ